MAKLFGFPINVEEDGGRGGGSSTNSRSAAQPDGDAMNSSAGFSESGPAPMDSESDLRSSFIDFFGRESHEMQRVSRGVDISGGFDDAMEEDVEIELTLGIGAGSVTGDKETDSGRVEVESLEDFMMNVYEDSSIMDMTEEELLDILPGLGGEYHGDYFDDIFEPPPVMATRAASKRVVDELPVVEINSEELRNGKIACAICMGDFVVKEKVTRLPCWHYYHGECIVPWLEMKNTCPVCRFALPTDDL
ncbi:probable E3 ubiquitin-protein ligase RHC2A [Brassica rapa]|uniref:probable E3 ubiquitin-protein ligase RHC2A n=1 Tax=Brassica campestris TaxID=3711 RepID=UPI0004F1B534|nr:probable E3 ubiquitin-protein ligase RHC2A [Brassica rapa]